MSANPKFIYAFKNDDNINYLSDQLCTIGEFNFYSKEQMYAKAEELKAVNDTAGLKRVTNVIKAYESIVKGNYIETIFFLKADNLSCVLSPASRGREQEFCIFLLRIRACSH